MRLLHGVAIVLAAQLLGGCVANTRAIWLEHPGGGSGSVAWQKGPAVRIERPGLPASEARVPGYFAAALGAQPPLPQRFLIYFETGSAWLTPASARAIERAVQVIAERGRPAVSVIGHSDTLGSEARNEQLGLMRARKIADLLASRGVEVLELQVTSHGERNLLVATPDATAEPRNRRVEISIR